MSTLYDLAADLREVLDQLDECEDDEQVSELMDKACEAESDLSTKAEAYVKVLRNLESDIAAIETEVERLKRRKDKRAKAIERLKSNILVAMDAAYMDAIETPLGRWSKRTSPWSVSIVDESIVPERFLVPQPPKVSKAAILAEFKATGECFDGCEISQREYVMLR